MAPITHQTIRLGRGKHRSPADGACVMELASMLAGERFSDHPLSVCPVIGSVLRAYNDAVDDERRQDLYAYAARVVGSRGSRRLEESRAERLSSWVSEVERHRWTRLLLPARLRALAPKQPIHAVAARAVHAVIAGDDHSHVEVLALVDDLLAMGTGGRPAGATTGPGTGASGPRSLAPTVH